MVRGWLLTAYQPVIEPKLAPLLPPRPLRASPNMGPAPHLKRLGVMGRAFILIACASLISRAQGMEARISVLSLSPARVRVEGIRSAGSSVWSFRNTYAGAIGLAERIESLTLADAAGEVPVRKLAPGEYAAARVATRFRYEVRLDPPVAQSDAAHISWLSDDHGLILPGDLLPQPLAGAKIRLSLPMEWRIASVADGDSDGQFEVADADQAVFFVSRRLQERRARVDSLELLLATAGTWDIDEAGVMKAATDILKEYKESMDGLPCRRAMIVVAPFPRPAGAPQWSAETRGGTVMFLAGTAPVGRAGLTRLSVQLAHELFHLWVPNGLALDGDYGWFYEGFTLYRAALASMKLGWLTFQDYLDAMARAYDGYKLAADHTHLSLLEASQRRWSGATALVYNKGMLAAFIYDLTLRERTANKLAIYDAYREIFHRHGGAKARADGDAAVLGVLSGTRSMADFINLYVKGADVIDLTIALAPFGLRAERVGGRTRIYVAEDLNKTQRALLRDLGYEDRAQSVSPRAREQMKKHRALRSQ